MVRRTSSRISCRRVFFSSIFKKDCSGRRDPRPPLREGVGLIAAHLLRVDARARGLNSVPRSPSAAVRYQSTVCWIGARKVQTGRQPRTWYALSTARLEIGVFMHRPRVAANLPNRPGQRRRTSSPRPPPADRGQRADRSYDKRRRAAAIRRGRARAGQAGASQSSR